MNNGGRSVVQEGITIGVATDQLAAALAPGVHGITGICQGTAVAGSHRQQIQIEDEASSGDPLARDIVVVIEDGQGNAGWCFLECTDMMLP